MSHLRSDQRQSREQYMPLECLHFPLSHNQNLLLLESLGGSINLFLLHPRRYPFLRRSFDEAMAPALIITIFRINPDSISFLPINVNEITFYSLYTTISMDDSAHIQLQYTFCQNQVFVMPGEYMLQGHFV